MADRIITGSAIMIGNSTIKGKLNKQVDPPIPLNLIIIGDNAPIGDVCAGKYTLLHLDTMKQVVGTQDEVTDEYKEYFGPILWSLSGSNGHLENNSGSETFLSISATGSFVVSASCRGNLVNLTVNPTYQQSTYLVSSFADLQEIERCVNNDVESTCTLTPIQGISYTPTDGNGFAGAVFRLANDIDFNNRGVFIGRSISGNTKSFKAAFNGAWYSFRNIGGTYSENDRNDTVNTSFIGRIYGSRLDNLYVYGSVTNNATSKLFGCILGSIEGSTISIRNIYTDINIDATSTSYSKSSPIAGWLTANSTLINCVSAGINVSYDRPTGFTLGTIVANSCITIGKLILYRKTSSSIIVDLNSSSSIFNYCASLSTHEIASGNAFEYIGAIGPNTYSYEAIKKSANASRLLMCNGGYKNTEIYSLNGFENATANKTKAQLQSGSLFNRPEWLEVAGFYPVPRNNPFITEAKVLAKVHQ